MKKIYIIIAMILISASTFAQVPSKMSYQAIVRNSSDQLARNQNIGMQISILQGSFTGSAIFVEQHSISTNANGLISLKIGEGTPVTGSISSINWSTGPYFIKTQTDLDGGSNYTITGVSQLLSVPYALYALSSGNDEVDDADADPTNEIQTMSLTGTLLELSDGGGSVTLPTSGGGGGDNWGAQVVKTDATLTGDGTSTDPLSVVGDLTDNQTLSVSGNDLTISDGNTVALPNSSLWSEELDGIHSYENVFVGNGDYDPTVIFSSSTNGDFTAIRAQNNSDKPTLSVSNVGNGLVADFGGKIRIYDETRGEGKVLTSNAFGVGSWQTPASSLWAQSGENIVYSDGSVNVGSVTPDSRILLQSFTNSDLYALGAINNGSNPTIYAMNNGTGPSAWIAGKMKITDGTEGDGKVLVSDADGNSSWRIPYWDLDSDAHALGTNYTVRLGNASGPWNARIVASSYSSEDRAIVAMNSSTTEAALDVSNHSGGPAARFFSFVKIKDGTQGNGKILTSDADGNASWQTSASTSSLWTESGSNVYRSSGRVGIGTTSPTAILDVRNSDPSVASIYTEKANGWAFHANSYESNGVSVVASSSGGTAVIAEAAGAGTVKLASTADDAAGYFQGNVYMTSGNVGIGTTSPSDKLQIKGGFIKLDEHYGITILNTSGYSSLSTVANNLILSNAADGDILFNTKTGNSISARARIKSDGDVEVMNNLFVNKSAGISKNLTVGGNVLVDENLNIGKDLTVNGGNFDLNSTGENWLSVLRGAGQNAGIAFKEVGAANTQWIFPYFRGWQSDNLIVRDEAANKDVMTFVAGNGRVGIGTSSPSTLLHVAGTITEDSDIRLKENIHTIDSALIKINQIRGVSFDWKDKERNDDHAQLGVIAQEIKEIFPALVFVSDDEMGTLSVNYDGLIAPLIEAVKAQQKQIEALKTENSTLKTDNKQIVDRLDELENLVTGYAKK